MDVRFSRRDKGILNSKVTIRDEAPGDIIAISEVTIDAFKTSAISQLTEQFIVQALRAAKEEDMDIYVCGHGGWGVDGRSSIFVQVPAGTEVVFYKEIGDVLYVSEAEAILRGAPNALRPVRVIRSFESCPEMTLFPAREFWRSLGAAATAGGANWHAVASPTQLSYFLRAYTPSRLHWIACSSRMLEPVKR